MHEEIEFPQRDIKTWSNNARFICISFQIEVKRNCGNKIIEEEEECDCGSLEDCISDPCCDGITCKLKSEAECAAGACCQSCKVSWFSYFYVIFASIIKWQFIMEKTVPDSFSTSKCMLS